MPIGLMPIELDWKESESSPINLIDWLMGNDCTNNIRFSLSTVRM